MDDVISDILTALRDKGELGPAELDRIIRRHSKRAHDGRRIFAKKRILPYYLDVRAENGEHWRSWDVNADLDAAFIKTLQMKPRRSASGVATITVITKPWPCMNNCVYCPNDPAMPKSYLSDEPACQRAKRNSFHPYLQVARRLRTLSNMGHETGKVELIILGGTWLDYPAKYRTWFVSELFRALDDSDATRERMLHEFDESGIEPSVESDLFPLDELQQRNEEAEHRVVGLVVETRPDTLTCEALRDMRQLGCTKVQIGVQSVDERILGLNGRHETPETISQALDLARLFGFKTHAHFMLNLLGATPQSDKRDFATFATDRHFVPDEVKLYPCALVGGTKLVSLYEEGAWRPYEEDELIDVLCENMRATPAFMRVSRMIRDISAKDILVGNKKTNLRQLVDDRLEQERPAISEIRFREIATQAVDLNTIEIDDIAYDTISTREHFLQWITDDNRIIGFLRLSLPSPECVAQYGNELPIQPGEAMIREVHVYGFATNVDTHGTSAQHRGLGRTLVEKACEIARNEGYHAMNVISAVGTRGYYRRLGFADNGLYQQRKL